MTIPGVNYNVWLLLFENNSRSITIQKQHTQDRVIDVNLKRQIQNRRFRFIYKLAQHFFTYHFWYISDSPFIKLGTFIWFDFSINYHGRKGETIKLLPYCMIDIIYKTAKPSHLKKLQTIQNINNLMLHVIFIFSDWILIK